jgi:predicted ATPase
LKVIDMLTRLEVDGFKNLIDFSVDFGPFNCIAGPNGVGKSNLFDAIRFLSLLTEHTLIEAALLIRGSGVDSSDIRDLFWSASSGYSNRFRIAAEMIVDPQVNDDFGRPAEATSTFLRYEIEIGFEPAAHRGNLGRLILLSETLDYITEGEAASKLKFPHSAQNFRRTAVINKRRTPSGFISVRKAEDGQTEIIVHQDGGSRGPGQVAPASTAPRTIVGTSNTSATPTILAARREMQKWQVLALEPSAMRKPDRFQTDPFITANGGHLPATLYRLATDAEKRNEDSSDVYTIITNRLAELVPVSNLKVEVDDVRQLLTLQVNERDGVVLPAASLSDGTLRFLTLSILVADPRSRGLICIEEPENGIHPAKMPEMVKLLKDIAVDPMRALSSENPFKQIIVATHSPAFVQLQDKDDLLFAVDTKVRSANGRPMRTLKCRPLYDTWRAKSGEPAIGLATILAYLSSPPGAQLELPHLINGIE